MLPNGGRDGVVSMSKRHGYGGNFECNRHGGSKEFEFRIIVESDGGRHVRLVCFPCLWCGAQQQDPIQFS